MTCHEVVSEQDQNAHVTTVCLEVIGLGKNINFLTLSLLGPVLYIISTGSPGENSTVAPANSSGEAMGL